MKTLFQNISILLLPVLFSSCKKEHISGQSLSSIVVTNAIIDGQDIKLNTNTVDSSKINNAKIFTLNSSSNSPVKLYPRTDPAMPYFDKTLPLEEHGVYSLYLSGLATSVDYVFVKDTIPGIYIDSFIGVRFVNLCSNSSPVSITLASAPTVNLFTGIGYKSVTGFVRLPVPTGTLANTVTFQVKNAAGIILSTYTIPLTTSTTTYPILSTHPNTSLVTARFRTQTLVIKGLTGTSTGPNAFGVFPINNFL